MLTCVPTLPSIRICTPSTEFLKLAITGTLEWRELPLHPKNSAEYVRDFAQWLETPLIEKHPPRTYEELVMEYGFPGPAAHRYMYIWLKERPLREVRREAQRGQRRRVMFITGVRSSESQRRMGHVEPVQRDGNIVWVAPIRDFEHKDIWDYRDESRIPRNEVVEYLHMSGECLCGAFSKPKELEWLAICYPDVADIFWKLFTICDICNPEGQQ